jgi:hypothetical protein
MQPDAESKRIILDLLNSVQRDGGQSQRRRASEFGVAVGLVNAYLKFCIKKGYVKVRRFPARRYSYLLTPKGFAEKSRLTIMHLSNSLTFFRQARSDCATVFEEAASRDWKRVLLAGATEVAEISTLSALESGVAIAGVVDPTCGSKTFMRFPVFSSFQAVDGKFDGVVVTDIKTARKTFADAVAHCGEHRVLVPSLLSISPLPKAEAAQ